MSSVVRFNITQRTAEGARVPIVDGGRVVLEPTRLIVVEGDPDEMVIPARITVPLVDGRADVLMDATGVAWCWRIVVRGARRDPLQEGYYTIPESATPLDYPTDLVEVDPKTLVPAESAVPAWEAAVEVVQSHEDAAALAAAQASGSASSAAASAQSAANSAGDASGSAGTAATKATEASTSATNAASSASAANVSATNADAAKTAASGSATSAAANASQAANSASTASTKATEATNSAIAAASSAATASAAKAATEAVDITVGTVTTGTPDEPAAAEIVGEAPAFTLNLMLPKGDAGGLVVSAGLPADVSIDSINDPGIVHVIGRSMALGAPVENFTGFIHTIIRSGAYRQQIAYQQLGGSRVWSRGMQGTGWPAWTLVGGSDLTGTGMPNGVVAAPPGSYYTDTAGTNGAWRWLKKSGTGNTGWECIVGDTGWRDVSSWLSEWVVPANGFFHVRRVGPQVTFRVCVAPAKSRYGAWDSTQGTFWTGFILNAQNGWLPSAFGYERPLAPLAIDVRGTAVLRYFGPNRASLYATYGSGTLAAASRVEGLLSWPVDSPWPATLPGTPA